MTKHRYAIIVLLARQGIKLQIHNDIMHEDLAVIWLSVNYSVRKRMEIGGIYREHQHIFMPKPYPSLSDIAQLDRWNQILVGWKAAAKYSMCTIIGDMNLDYLKWQTPDFSLQKMVDRTKDEI